MDDRDLARLDIEPLQSILYYAVYWIQSGLYRLSVTKIVLQFVFDILKTEFHGPL